MSTKRKVHVYENGVKVYDDHVLPIQRERYKTRNVHEANEEDIFRKLIGSIPTGGCYVNIGTAAGYYPILAKRSTPNLSVHAVEPLGRHRRYFAENLVLNGLRKKDITIHSEAITAVAGKVELNDKGHGSMIRIEAKVVAEQIKVLKFKILVQKLLNRIGLRRSRGKKHISTLSLDGLCSKIKNGIDLCHLNVQGHELEVLTGGTEAFKNGWVKTFLIGTHSRQLHKECIEVLIENGYDIEHDEYETKDQPDGILVASLNQPDP